MERIPLGSPQGDHFYFSGDSCRHVGAKAIWFNSMVVSQLCEIVCGCLYVFGCGCACAWVCGCVHGCAWVWVCEWVHGWVSGCPWSLHECVLVVASHIHTIRT